MLLGCTLLWGHKLQEALGTHWVSSMGVLNEEGLWDLAHRLPRSTPYEPHRAICSCSSLTAGFPPDELRASQTLLISVLQPQRVSQNPAKRPPHTSPQFVTRVEQELLNLWGKEGFTSLWLENSQTVSKC